MGCTSKAWGSRGWWSGWSSARCRRRAPQFAHELVATFLLTGGREAEVLGLEVDDVSLDRSVVTFRPNA
ncbi:MAG: hypothetical protein ACREXU_17735, partial [Gammaproteobacteria bacterium]